MISLPASTAKGRSFSPEGRAGAPTAGRGLSAAADTVTRMSGQMRDFHQFELEPEVRDWLDSLSDSDYKRVDEVCGMLAEKGTGLGGPWSDDLDGAVWELRVRLRQGAGRGT